MFCFKFKIYALSSSRVAALETTFFVHGNCCQLFQRTFFISQSYSVAATLMTDHWPDHWCKQFCLYLLHCWLQLFIVQLNEMLCCLVNWEFPKVNFLLFLSLFSTKIPTLWCLSHSKPAVQNNNTGHRKPILYVCLISFPVVSWRRAKYKQMYGLKSTLTASRWILK